MEIDKNDINKSVYISKDKDLCLIYLLVKGKDVVYVGQTKKGYLRPLSHNDKDFDGFYAIFCEEEDLEILEDTYIKKYLPKYNKVLSKKVNMSIGNVAKFVRKTNNCRWFTTNDVRKIIKENSINVYKDIDNVPMISSCEADYIAYLVRSGEYGKQ